MSSQCVCVIMNSFDLMLPSIVAAVLFYFGRVVGVGMCWYNEMMSVLITFYLFCDLIIAHSASDIFI